MATAEARWRWSGSVVLWFKERILTEEEQMTEQHCSARRTVAALSATLAALTVLAVALPQVAFAQPRPGNTESSSYGSGQTVHPYIVYTPRGWTADKRLPLLVVLHGCQTSAYQQMQANLYNPLADKKGFVVVYPDTDPAENAQPGPLARCWQFFSAQDWKRGQGDGAAIAEITRLVSRRWNVDRQRVYVMGMSAGAFLSADLAAEYPDLYAASGENAGSAYADPTCLLGGTGVPVAVSATLAFEEMGSSARIVPRLVIGGDADNGVSPNCADEALLQSLRTDNLVISGRETGPIRLTPSSVHTGQVHGGHSYTVSNYVDQHGCLIGQRFLVHGMGHFWSGGSSNPKWADFTDPKGPSAATASWLFLSRFTLDNTRQSCRSR